MSVNITSYPGVASGITNVSQCTPSLCPLELAVLKSVPSLPAMVTFASVFGLLLIAQIGAVLFCKTWSFTISMCLGLSLEIAGYLACIELHYNVFSRHLVIVQPIFLSIAPLFFTTAIYLSHSHLISHFGKHNSRLSPRIHTLIFLYPTSVSMILQATGAGLAASATTPSSADLGVYTTIGGLGIQIITVLGFVLLCAEFFWNVRRDHIEKDNTDWAARKIYLKSDHDKDRKVKLFVTALSISTALLLSSSVLHLAFLTIPGRHNSNAFTSPLATSDPFYLICNGALTATAALLMTAFHPGTVLAREWGSGGFWGGRRGEGSGKRDGGYESAGTDEGIQPVETPVFNKPWPV